jgi:hypothetical protein
VPGPVVGASEQSIQGDKGEGWTRRAPTTPLFDHLVGAADQRQRDGEPERSGRLHVNDQIESRRLLDRQFGWLLSFDNSACV